MSRRRHISLSRHFGSNSARSAGVFDSTYGVRDEALRTEITMSTNALRLALLRLYSRDATRRGGDEWDAAARMGMRP